MARTKALSDSNRTVIGFVVTAIIAIAFYMQTLPEDQKPPAYVFGILGGIVVVAQLAKDYLGVRDASTSRVSKETDPTYPQYREIKKETTV